MQPLRDRPSSELEQALREMGFVFDAGHPRSIREVIQVTRAPDGTARGAYLLVLADGARFKLRRVREGVDGEEAASWLARLADTTLARLESTRGLVWLEEWVEGVPWDEFQPTLQHFAAAGGWLGSLHGRHRVDGRDVRGLLEPEAINERLEEELWDLMELGGLGAEAAQELRAIVAASCPREAPVGLTHRDYCAANLIAAPGDELRVIDNEALGVSFLDWDLARTRSRWSMSDAEWACFLAAYERSAERGPDAGQWPYWRVVTQVRTARFFTKFHPGRAASRLAPLHDFIRGRGL